MKNQNLRKKMLACLLSSVMLLSFVSANTVAASINAPLPIDFIVWNDNFATGEFTTAVIIDLGPDKSIASSVLSNDMFSVTGRDFNVDGLRRESVRDINRVYINSEQKVLGYLGEVTNSPDYQPGLDSGRYIVVEFPWPKSGGFATNFSGSTTQEYSIIANKDIILEDGTTLTNVEFNQTATVNTIIDQFEEGTIPLTGTGDTPPDLGYTQYIHKDTNGQPVQGLPLYIYFHGNTRGGNVIGDSYAPLRSANGAIALMKKMEEDPKFTSHILAFRSTSGHIGSGHAPVDQVKAVIDDLIAQGLVDENRIYVSGFSLGAGYTNELANSYLGFFAAIAPMAGFGFPNAEQAAEQDTSLWAFVNNYDHSFIFEGLQAFVSEEGAFSAMEDAKVTFFETIESFVWPYDQWPTSRFPPYENWFGHEIEAAVLYNKIVEPNWNIRPTHSTIPWNDDYTYVFDWMFAQSKNPPALTEEPTSQPEETTAPTNTEETAKSPEPTNTEETADPEDDSFPIWIIVIVVLAAIVVTGGIILLRKKTAK